MYDLQSRKRYLENTRTQSLVDGMASVVKKSIEEQDTKSLEEIKKLSVTFEKIGKALVIMYQQMVKPLVLPKSIQVESPEYQKLRTALEDIDTTAVAVFKHISKPLPSLYQIKGEVEVQNPIEVKNFLELGKYFDSMEKRIKDLTLAINNIPPAQVNIPKQQFPKIDIPKFISESNPKLEALMEKLNENIQKLSTQKSEKIKQQDTSKLEAVLESLNEKIDTLQPQEITFPRKIDIGNFPRQMIPQPVTNININPLQGQIKTTSTTVGTTRTTLPGYGQLFNRRALQIYNNSSNTIYYGGSDVTAANGIPVTASSFSNIIDAGYNMIVYGIASSSGNDIRVIEVAAVSVGGTAIQE